MSINTRTLIPMGSEIRALDMHGCPVAPFTPFSVRGPQLLELKDGTLVCLYSAKYDSQADEAPCCTVLMRSADSGATWGDARVLTYSGAPGDVGGAPVYDEERDVLLYFGRTRQWKPGCEQDRLLSEEDQVKGRVDERFWVAESADGGLSWSDYREVFLDAPADWRVRHCPTPGTGFQLKRQPGGRKNGRLIVPANHIGSNENGRNDCGCHLIVSDDHGMTWKTGAVAAYPGGNECLATELSDGTLILNCRTFGSEPANLRLQCTSRDGGDTFEEIVPVPSLYDPSCHGGFACTGTGSGESVYCLLPTGALDKPWTFLGITSRWGKREKLTLYRSADKGRTYSPVLQLTPEGEFTAYSAILAKKDGTLLCAWESGPEIGLYRDIHCALLTPGVDF